MESNSEQQLALIVYKLDNITTLLQQHIGEDRGEFQEIRRFNEGYNGEPGMKGRVDRVEIALAEQIKKRDKQVNRLWAFWFAAVGGFFTAIWAKLF